MSKIDGYNRYFQVPKEGNNGICLSMVKHFGPAPCLAQKNRKNRSLQMTPEYYYVKFVALIVYFFAYVNIIIEYSIFFFNKGL